jgi:hypothetical protein
MHYPRAERALFSTLENTSNNNFLHFNCDLSTGYYMYRFDFLQTFDNFTDRISHNLNFFKLTQLTTCMYELLTKYFKGKFGELF